MRVATRRLRAALEVFEPCFPRKRHRKALKKVKALADALGERRDADVEIACSRASPRKQRRRIAECPRILIEELRARQGEANEALAPLRRVEAAEEAAATAEEAGQEGGGDEGAQRSRGWTPAARCDRISARIVAVRLDELRGLADGGARPRCERGAARHADRGQATALRARDLRALSRRGGRAARRQRSACNPSSATCTTAT